MNPLSTAVRGTIAIAGDPLGICPERDVNDHDETASASHATDSVTPALENEFDVELPDADLRRSSFQSLDAVDIVRGRDIGGDSSPSPVVEAPDRVCPNSPTSRGDTWWVNPQNRFHRSADQWASLPDPVTFIH